MSTTEAKTGTKRKAAWQPPVYVRYNRIAFIALRSYTAL